MKKTIHPLPLVLLPFCIALFAPALAASHSIDDEKKDELEEREITLQILSCESTKKPVSLSLPLPSQTPTAQELTQALRTNFQAKNLASQLQCQPKDINRASYYRQDANQLILLDEDKTLWSKTHKEVIISTHYFIRITEYYRKQTKTYFYRKKELLNYRDIELHLEKINRGRSYFWSIQANQLYYHYGPFPFPLPAWKSKGANNEELFQVIQRTHFLDLSLSNQVKLRLKPHHSHTTTCIEFNLNKSNTTPQNTLVSHVTKMVKYQLDRNSKKSKHSKFFFLQKIQERQVPLLGQDKTLSDYEIFTHRLAFPYRIALSAIWHVVKNAEPIFLDFVLPDADEDPSYRQYKDACYQKIHQCIQDKVECFKDYQIFIHTQSDAQIDQFDFKKHYATRHLFVSPQYPKNPTQKNPTTIRRRVQIQIDNTSNDAHDLVTFTLQNPYPVEGLQKVTQCVKQELLKQGKCNGRDHIYFRDPNNQVILGKHPHFALDTLRKCFPARCLFLHYHRQKVQQTTFFSKANNEPLTSRDIDSIFDKRDTYLSNNQPQNVNSSLSKSTSPDADIDQKESMWPESDDSKQSDISQLSDACPKHPRTIYVTTDPSHEWQTFHKSYLRATSKNLPSYLYFTSDSYFLHITHHQNGSLDGIQPIAVAPSPHQTTVAQIATKVHKQLPQTHQNNYYSHLFFVKFANDRWEPLCIGSTSIRRYQELNPLSPTPFVFAVSALWYVSDREKNTFIDYISLNPSRNLKYSEYKTTCQARIRSYIQDKVEYFKDYQISIGTQPDAQIEQIDQFDFRKHYATRDLFVSFRDINNSPQSIATTIYRRVQIKIDNPSKDAYELVTFTLQNPHTVKGLEKVTQCVKQELLEQKKWNHRDHIYFRDPINNHVVLGKHPDFALDTLTECFPARCLVVFYDDAKNPHIHPLQKAEDDAPTAQELTQFFNSIKNTILSIEPKAFDPYQVFVSPKNNQPTPPFTLDYLSSIRQQLPPVISLSIPYHYFIKISSGPQENQACYLKQDHPFTYQSLLDALKEQHSHLFNSSTPISQQVYYQEGSYKFPLTPSQFQQFQDPPQIVLYRQPFHTTHLTLTNLDKDSHLTTREEIVIDEAQENVTIDHLVTKLEEKLIKRSHSSSIKRIYIYQDDDTLYEPHQNLDVRTSHYRYRIAQTRFRLSSHSSTIELGLLPAASTEEQLRTFYNRLLQDTANHRPSDANHSVVIAKKNDQGSERPFTFAYFEDADVRKITLSLKKEEEIDNPQSIDPSILHITMNVYEWNEDTCELTNKTIAVPRKYMPEERNVSSPTIYLYAPASSLPLSTYQLTNSSFLHNGYTIYRIPRKVTVEFIIEGKNPIIRQLDRFQFIQTQIDPITPFGCKVKRIRINERSTSQPISAFLNNDESIHYIELESSTEGKATIYLDTEETLWLKSIQGTLLVSLIATLFLSSYYYIQRKLNSPTSATPPKEPKKIKKGNPKIQLSLAHPKLTK